jgi:hypothetical protein
VADIVELILQLRNVSEFVSGAKQASTAAGDIGDKTEEAGKKASSGWKGLAKWAGGAAAIYGATRFVKGAVSATEDLAKATITVSRTTGMDTQTSSEWAALMKERGVSTKQFQTSLVKLSKTMETSRTGTVKENATVKALRAQIDAVSAAGGKKAPAELAKLSKAIATAQGAGLKARSTLDALGVSQRDVAKGNTADTLYKVADALERMRNPAQRAALMQSLFGRSGQALLPILMKGREGVKKLLDEQKAAGNYISGKGIKSAKDLIQQQRALNTAFAGVKVQLGQALLPVLVSAGKFLVQLMKIIRPLTSNATAFKVVIGAIAAAMIAYKVATIAATIQQLELNAAMIANPVGLIIAGVAALVIGVVVLYKKWKWFHDALNATWAWIKTNWPLLLAILIGPFAVAALEIYKHFDAIKGAVLGAFDAIKGALPTVANAFVTAFATVKNAVRGALDFLIRGWNSLQFKIPGVHVGPVHFGGVTLGVPQIPLLAQGGVVSSAGMAVVGEAGPELVSLPAGAGVTPLDAGLRPLEIVVPVMLDRREIARAVARVASDQLARA